MATLPISPANRLDASKKPSRACSYCGSDELYRQRPRGLIERHVFRAFHVAPYWCAACDRRSYQRVRNTHRQVQATS
jgi:DNA-directed RNA polymerase subunit RPC12/RpoP